MKKLLTIVLATFFLTACSEKTDESYTFVGESEHWRAEFVYDVSETWGENNGKRNYSNEEEYMLTFTYKGAENDLASIKNISYGYETVSGSGSNTGQFTEPVTQTVFKIGGKAKNTARLFPQHVITAYVQWDDFEEKFELNIKE